MTTTRRAALTLSGSLLLVASATLGPAGERDALEIIESARGGRHWVDEPTDPPKTPAESLACFAIEPGCRIELFAAEPLVVDPVAMAFDEQGRMFVVEYGDYPNGPEEGGAPLSRVVLLEDVDQDHRADRRTVFAEQLDFAHSLMPFREGLIVATQTELISLKDSDGDRVADERRVLFSGFVPAHPQMHIGCPRWGIDNWVYCNYADGEITSPGSTESQTFRRTEFRFNPLTMEYGPAAGRGQYGNTIDPWGRRFFTTNRNPVMEALIPWEAAQRNRFATISSLHYDVGPAGGDTRVYPITQMKSNFLSHAGTHTAACGVTGYLGDLFDEPFTRSVFVCEPIGHLVTRSIVKPNGVELTTERARPKADFLASTDTWFRPASLETGPDGALYLADMYRLWVEHPRFLPDEIAAQLDWRAGDDRGRIWRIVPETQPTGQFAPPQTSEDLVRLLSDANGWKRYLAQRLIVERQLTETAPALGELAGADDPKVRLHALRTLKGIGKLNRSQLARALDDEDGRVREHAVMMAAERLDGNESLVDGLAALASDDAPRVRLQVALALGETQSAAATEALAELLLRNSRSDWIVKGVQTSAATRSGALLARLADEEGFTGKASPDRIRVIRDLATVVGNRGDESELTELLRAVATSQSDAAWWRRAAVAGLAEGLQRRDRGASVRSLAALIGDPGESARPYIAAVRELLAGARNIAADRNKELADRLAAIELLRYEPFDQVAEVYDVLLGADQPAQIQTACIVAMQENAGAKSAPLLLKHWPHFGPTVQGYAINMLLGRTDSAEQLLRAMAAGTISPSVVDIDSRVRLLKHSNDRLRELAVDIFGGAISENRKAVLDDYKAALTLDASAAAGAKAFEKLCIKCHRVDGRGTEVGPDISDAANRTREALLYDILDPNAKVEPRYADYLIITTEGRVFNGLIVAETPEAVVLRQAEGREERINRSDIEEMRSTGRSLMPEGVEKDLTVQEMADLLEFLTARSTTLSAVDADTGSE